MPPRFELLKLPDPWTFWNIWVENFPLAPVQSVCDCPDGDIKFSSAVGEVMPTVGIAAAVCKFKFGEPGPLELLEPDKRTSVVREFTIPGIN